MTQSTQSQFFEQITDSNVADITFGTAGIKKDCIEKNLQRIPVEKMGMAAKNYVKQNAFYTWPKV